MLNIFYAFFMQQESIDRWNKSKSIETEYVSGHCLQVAVFTHALCTLENKLSDNKKSLDANYAAVCAMFHDFSESICEDMNSKFKKMSPTFAKLSEALEAESLNFLYNQAPPLLEEVYHPILFQKQALSDEVNTLIKAADLLSALAKAKQEFRCGNLDFKKPVNDITLRLEGFAEKFPSVRYFLDDVMPSFGYSVDDLLDLVK